MNGNIHFTGSLVVFLLIAGCASHRSRPAKLDQKSKLEQIMASHTRGEALSAMVLLEELRAQRVNIAIESLEFSIDAAVVMIWHQMQNTKDEYIKTESMSLLKTLKEYRVRHPRKKEGNILQAGEPLELETQKLTSEANEILRKIR